MAEVLSVTCDRCRSKIGTPRRNRGRVRWSKESARGYYDICVDCESDIMVWLGLKSPDAERLPASPARRAKPATTPVINPTAR